MSRWRWATVVTMVIVGVAMVAAFGLYGVGATASSSHGPPAAREALSAPTTRPQQTRTVGAPTSVDPTTSVAVPDATPAASRPRSSTTTSTVPAQTYAAPSSISANCTVDVTAALNSWIASVPDGRAGAPNTVALAPDGCYAIGSATDLSVTSRNDLTFDGDGATLRVAATVDAPSWYFGQDTGIVVENLHIRGTNTISGIAAGDPPALAAITYQPNRFGSSCSDGSGGVAPTCFESGLEFDHVAGVAVEDVTTDATWGDGITLGGEHDGADLSSNIVIKDVSIDRNGRQGIEVGTVDGVVIGNTQILHSWGSGIDLEVNAPDGTISDVEIGDSYINAHNAAITPDGAAGVNGLFIHNNEIKFHDPSDSWVIGNPITQGQAWRVDDNVVDIAMDEAPALTFSNVNGIEVSGNTSLEEAPPSARQGEALPAVLLAGDGGAISITNNNFTGDTESSLADSATSAAATFTVCGNLLAPGVAPAAC